MLKVVIDFDADSNGTFFAVLENPEKCLQVEIARSIFRDEVETEAAKYARLDITVENRCGDSGLTHPQ